MQNNAKVLNSTNKCAVCNEQFLERIARNQHQWDAHRLGDPFDLLDFEGMKPGAHVSGSSLQFDIDQRVYRAEVLGKIVGQLQRNKDGSYSVASQFTPEICYHVDLDNNECNCPDHIYRGVICKHILAVTITGEFVREA